MSLLDSVSRGPRLWQKGSPLPQEAAVRAMLSTKGPVQVCDPCDSRYCSGDFASLAPESRTGRALGMF